MSRGDLDFELDAVDLPTPRRPWYVTVGVFLALLLAVWLLKG